MLNNTKTSSQISSPATTNNAPKDKAAVDKCDAQLRQIEEQLENLKSMLTRLIEADRAKKTPIRQRKISPIRPRKFSRIPTPKTPRIQSRKTPRIQSRKPRESNPEKPRESNPETPANPIPKTLAKPQERRSMYVIRKPSVTYRILSFRPLLSFRLLLSFRPRLPLCLPLPSK